MFLFVMLLFFTGFMETTSDFTVVGPDVPLVVETGGELVLPCSLKHHFSAVDMMVEWNRTDLSETDRLVHRYKDHQDTNDKQIRSYSGRTSLFKDELQKGNTSLKVSAVQPSDEGVYQCGVKSDSWYDYITVHVEVKVHLKVAGPFVPLVVEAGEDLVLPCSIKPSISAENMMVMWKRLHLHSDTTNALVHLYEGYEDRNDKQMESYRGRTALFQEKLQKGNTSLKLLAVQPTDEGVYQCHVQYGSWYGDVTVYAEVKEKGFHAWKIAIICISVFSIILMVFTAYILKERFSKRKLSPAQCSVIAYLRLKSDNVREELDLKKYNTSEEGYRRLIPAIKNCRKARFAGCNLRAESITILSAALQTENCSLKELDISNNVLQESKMELLSAALKSSCCKLEILKFTGCNLKRKSQTELDISNNVLQESGMELLSAALESSCCKLNILKFAGCNLTAESINILSAALQTENCSLKKLDISNNVLQESEMKPLSAALKSSCCKLEILKFAGCNLTAESINILSAALQTENCSLKELDISNNVLQESEMEPLSAALKSSCHKLEILKLPCCNLRAESINILSEALRTENCSLKELDISNNSVEESGVELLSAALKFSYCELEILKLALCKLSVQSCDPLQSVSPLESSSLKELDLSNNDLQDTGVELLSAGLKSSWCKVQILRLSGSMITEKGCSSLASALTSKPFYLKELDLAYNHPRESGVKLLTARLEDPHCSLSTLRVEHGGENRMKPGLKKYYCEFTLDPNTAHRLLSLSDGNRKVERVKERQSYPDHPERFDWLYQVLSRESVTGRCYWEAEWSGTGATLAVTYKSISRNGGFEDCLFGWNEKSWTLECSNNSYSVCHNKIKTDISTSPSGCKRVGVYVDCAAGTLSFYSVSSDTHLYTFNTTFTKPLFVGFRLFHPNCSAHVCKVV